MREREREFGKETDDSQFNYLVPHYGSGQFVIY